MRQSKFFFSIVFLLFTSLYFHSCSSTNVMALKGTYYGILPCASCAGINVRLVLNKDNTFKKTELYNKGGQLKVVKPFETSGTYTLENGILVLSAEEEGMNKFRVNSNSKIEMLDLEGKPIEYLREMYILRKDKKPENFTLQPIYPEK